MKNILILSFSFLPIFSYSQLEKIDSLYKEVSKLDYDLNLPREIKLYYEILILDSNNYQAILGMGKAYYSRFSILGSVDQVYLDSALIMLTKACESAKADFNAFFERGQLFYEFLKYDYALVDFNRALELNPDLFRIRWERAKIYMIKGQNEKAISDLDFAIGKSPNDDWLYLMRANCNANLKKFDECSKDLNNALSINSKNHETYLLIGDLYALQGNYKEAVKKYSFVLKQAQIYAIANLKRANSYYAMGEIEMAESDWEIAKNKGYIIDDESKEIKFGIEGYKTCLF